MQLRIFIVLFFLLNFGLVQAQSYKDKLYTGRGFQFGATFMPSFLLEEETFDTITQFQGIELIGFHFSVRYNLFDIGDDQSLAVGIAPALTLGVGGYSNDTDAAGMGSLNMPLEISYNTGAGATYNSTKNRGFAIKTGIDFSYLPMIGFGDTSLKNFKKSYSPIHLTLAVRYFGKRSNFLKEFFVRYNFGKNIEGSAEVEDLIKPVVFRFGFTRFLNY